MHQIYSRDSASGSLALKAKFIKSHIQIYRQPKPQSLSNLSQPHSNRALVAVRVVAPDLLHDFKTSENFARQTVNLMKFIKIPQIFASQFLLFRRCLLVWFMLFGRWGSSNFTLFKFDPPVKFTRLRIKFYLNFASFCGTRRGFFDGDFW